MSSFDYNYLVNEMNENNKDGKKVLVPWEEYQRLVEDSEALNKAKEELKKDCKERGLYVEYKYDPRAYCSAPQYTIPRLHITSNDEALKMAQEEIDRLSISDLLGQDFPIRLFQSGR